MAQKSRPDPANGTVVNADEYEGLALGSVEDGVIGTPADTAVVYADSTGRQVKVRSGKQAVIRGYSWWADPTTDEIIANLPANTSGNPRIDRLVLRLDRTSRQVRTVYLQGTAAVTPVAPALTQNTSLTSGVWDFPLARWTVANGYTTVAATDVTVENWYRPPFGNGILCNSTSRPFGAYAQQGMRVYEYDTKTERCHDGAGWQVYAFLPPFLYAAKTADGAAIIDTALRDEVDLQLTVLPNAVYDVEAFIVYQSSTTADLRIGWSGPAGATFIWNIGGLDSASGSASGATYYGANGIGGTDVVAGVGAFTPIVTRATGRLVTGNTGGAFKLRHAQGQADNVNGTQIKSDSSLTATRRV